MCANALSTFGPFTKISFANAKHHKGYLFPLTTASISVLVYPLSSDMLLSMHTRPNQPFSASSVSSLSLSLNRAPHHTTHAHIEHAHFWFVSISFTVSNILMKMRSTSSRTHQSSIYTVHIVIWQMLWEMWHDCSGTF